MYGFPGPGAIDAYGRGEAVLGDCLRSDHDPSRSRLDCSTDVYRSELRGGLDDEG